MSIINGVGIYLNSYSALPIEEYIWDIHHEIDIAVFHIQLHNYICDSTGIPSQYLSGDTNSCSAFASYGIATRDVQPHYAIYSPAD